MRAKNSNFLRAWEIGEAREKSASTQPPLAPQSASTTPLLAPPEKELAESASNVAHSPASSPLLLAPKSASTSKRKRRFTPAGKDQLNVRIDKTLKAKLDVLAAAEGKTMNALIEGILAAVLAHDGARLLAPFDIDDDSTDDIIKLFARLTGRPMNAADREAYAEVRHYDQAVLKIGMYTTVFHCRGQRINSFRYFLPEIEKAASLIGSIGSPAEYVAHLKRRVKKEFGVG